MANTNAPVRRIKIIFKRDPNTPPPPPPRPLRFKLTFRGQAKKEEPEEYLEKIRKEAEDALKASGVTGNVDVYHAPPTVGVLVGSNLLKNGTQAQVPAVPRASENDNSRSVARKNLSNGDGHDDSGIDEEDNLDGALDYEGANAIDLDILPEPKEHIKLDEEQVNDDLKKMIKNMDEISIRTASPESSANRNRNSINDLNSGDIFGRAPVESDLSSIKDTMNNLNNIVRTLTSFKSSNGSGSAGSTDVNRIIEKDLSEINEKLRNLDRLVTEAVKSRNSFNSAVESNQSLKTDEETRTIDYNEIERNSPPISNSINGEDTMVVAEKDTAECDNKSKKQRAAPKGRPKRLKMPIDDQIECDTTRAEVMEAAETAGLDVTMELEPRRSIRGTSKTNIVPKEEPTRVRKRRITKKEKELVRAQVIAAAMAAGVVEIIDDITPRRSTRGKKAIQSTKDATCEPAQVQAKETSHSLRESLLETLESEYNTEKILSAVRSPPPPPVEPITPASSPPPIEAVVQSLYILAKGKNFPSRQTIQEEIPETPERELQHELVENILETPESELQDEIVDEIPETPEPELQNAVPLDPQLNTPYSDLTESQERQQSVEISNALQMLSDAAAVIAADSHSQEIRQSVTAELTPVSQEENIQELVTEVGNTNEATISRSKKRTITPAIDEGSPARSKRTSPDDLSQASKRSKPSRASTPVLEIPETPRASLSRSEAELLISVPMVEPEPAPPVVEPAPAPPRRRGRPPKGTSKKQAERQPEVQLEPVEDTSGRKSGRVRKAPKRYGFS
ncbi:hypothetical protein EDC01DRAFT_626114 [Geopyxis carbonaria]|nr:hypothetical protein EDC01DRAFT_626114 [Geopyxis carbonaria]